MKYNKGLWQFTRHVVALSENRAKTLTLHESAQPPLQNKQQ